MTALRSLRRGRWTVEDRAAQRLRLLPVEVPPTARAIRVALRTPPDSGAIDLGLWGPDGFRGWSGGARRDVVVATTVATPGYLPGPRISGAWEVALGLHHVPESGAPYEVLVGFERAEPPAEAVGRRSPGQLARPRAVCPPVGCDAGDGLRWWPGDLHTHTEHSDGELSVGEVAGLAAEAGLAFCAITDHNTVSHHAELAAAERSSGVALIAGQEVTTPDGHANVLGISTWVDFRDPPEVWQRRADTDGGLLVVNHPMAGDCRWELDEPPTGSLVEAWHAPCDLATSGALTAASLAWTRRWDGIAVGGSDFHRLGDPMRPGTPTTWVACAEPTAAQVVDAVGAGRVAVSADVAGPRLVRRDGQVVAIDADGCTVACPDGERRPVVGATAVIGDQPGRHLLHTHTRRLLALVA